MDLDSPRGSASFLGPSSSLGRKSREPVVRVGAEPRPDGSGPGDQDLVEAVERWLAAST